MATFLAPDKGKKASMMDMALDDVVAANKPKKKQGGQQQQQGGGKAAKKKGAARFDPYGAGGGGRRGGRQVAYGAPADVLCGRCGRGFAAADIVSFQNHGANAPHDPRPKPPRHCPCGGDPPAQRGLRCAPSARLDLAHSLDACSVFLRRGWIRRPWRPCAGAARLRWPAPAGARASIHLRSSPALRRPHVQMQQGVAEVPGGRLMMTPNGECVRKCNWCERRFSATDLHSFQQHILSKHSKAKNVQQQKGGAQKQKVPATALPLASRPEPTVGETPAPLLEIPEQPSAGATVV
jgi:hypothetical protein